MARSVTRSDRYALPGAPAPPSFSVGGDPDVAHRDGQALTDDRVVPAGGVADQHDPGHVGHPSGASRTLGGQIKIRPPPDIYAGTNQIQRMVVAYALLTESGMQS